MNDNAIYRGEAWLRNWSETAKGGRRITLQVEEDGPQIFKGYEGERFALILVPLGNDDQPMKKFMGDAPTREDGVEGKASNGVADKAVSSPAKIQRRWSEMRPSARAAMLTKDAEFQDYVTRFGYHATEADADKFVKARSNIESKRDLDADVNWPNLRMFTDMEGNFRAWQQARSHGAA